MNIENLPNCYPVYQLFITALESSPEERETIIEAAFAALKNLGFNPKGSFLPIHDAEGDDFCSQPLRSLSDTSHIIVQAGQYLAKHTPENEQKEEGKVKEISEKVFNIWNNKKNCLYLEGVKLIKGLEIGRPGRGEFSEDIKPFELKEGSQQEVVEYLNSQEDKSVKILLNAPGHTLAQ
ncbi:MAG: hypothetical protein LW832_06110, partial [Parachlamydia sp.]|nr:hypothetical protein [Parachlamydia sp.]